MSDFRLYTKIYMTSKKMKKKKKILKPGASESTIIVIEGPKLRV